jgi:hypothetical protein
VSESTKNWLKGLNLAVPPLLVIFIGIMRWRMRVSMHRKLESRGL